MPRKHLELDLFLDESGLFVETSTVPQEQARARQGRSFASQLAGLLVPRGTLSTSEAGTIRDRALRRAGLPEGQFHATELPRGGEYDTLVREVVEALKAGFRQPVRLVNQERVRFGDRAATYTNLVAELVLRICRQKLKEGESSLTIFLYPARVFLREQPDGKPVFLEKDDYRRRIQEYLAFAAVRSGLARESAQWTLGDLIIRPGADERIQLCDLLSNASHDDFYPCGPVAKVALQNGFGPYDFSLVFRELIERVELALADGALAQAIVSLAERLVSDDTSDDVRVSARLLLKETLTRLAALHVSGRDVQLRFVISWLEQIIDHQRALEQGQQLARWLVGEVEQPLRKLLTRPADAARLDWFAHALHTEALAACNHRGDLRGARRAVQALEALLPSMAGQWEHAGRLMQGLIRQAVHLTDCFEHDLASARMKIVAGYYSNLAGLFHDALPEVFPQRVHSDLHGRALGTWLQSELYAGLVNPARLDEARQLSDQAIDELTAPVDQERQFQYRCQLETAAGRWSEARSFLAKSLGLTENSHAALAEAIKKLGDASSLIQGFSLLHWFRLGSTAWLVGDEAETEAFRQALDSAKLLLNDWARGENQTDYPVHGILRRVAVIRALQGETDQALGALRRLAQLLATEQGNQVVLQTVHLAARAEVAAVLGAGHNRKLLDRDDADQPGMRQLLRRVRGVVQGVAPEIERLVSEWNAVVDEALQRDVGRERLLNIGRVVGY